MAARQSVNPQYSLCYNRGAVFKYPMFFSDCNDSS